MGVKKYNTDNPDNGYTNIEMFAHLQKAERISGSVSNTIGRINTRLILETPFDAQKVKEQIQVILDTTNWDAAMYPKTEKVLEAQAFLKYAIKRLDKII